MKEDWPGCLVKGYAPGVAVGMVTFKTVAAETTEARTMRLGDGRNIVANVFLLELLMRHEATYSTISSTDSLARM